MLHKNGINIRYLGKIASLCSNNYSKLFCEMQMIGRSCKKILNHFLADFVKNPDNSETSIQSIPIDFLNLIFGIGFESTTFWEEIL